MNSDKQIPPGHRSLVIVFIIISFSVLAAGYWYYTGQMEALLKEKQRELSAIADLKIRQISQWRIERIGNGIFLGENKLMSENFSRFLKNTSDKQLRSDITQSIKSLTINFDYKSVLLIDVNGIVKLSYPAQDTIIGDHLIPLLPDVARKRNVIMTDLHRANVVSFVHIDLIVPIINRSESDSLILGFLALRIDPSKILFPLVQSWPYPSKSAETLLIRKENDEIVFLNELRHMKNSELIFRLPYLTKKLAAAMALDNITGSVDAVDYRGVSVVAAMKKIPGTPWYMVAKMDRDEILTSLKWRMTLILIILLLLILTSGLFLGFLIRNQRARFYREKYEDELERLALVKHFDYILKFANDIILLFDKNFRIVEANDRALESYMYSRAEIIGMSIEKLRSPESLALLDNHILAVQQNESATFEAIHQRKDGSEFPVEVSSRLVKIEGSDYYQTISRDITERKFAEITLRESEDKFRKIFEESPLAIAITGKDYSFLRANESFCKMIGYSEEGLKFMTFRDFTHPDYISDDEISLMRLVKREIPIYHVEKQYIRNDGTVIWGTTTISIIRNNRGEVQFFLAMVEDSTARKKAENELIHAKEKAEESDRLKTSFLHNVSHEIRTPMNAIIGFSSLLNEPELTEAERTQYGEIIFQSSNQLLSVINDIVDIANVESGQVKLHIREMHLNSSLRSLFEQFMLKGKEQNIQLYLKTGLVDEESKIMTDSTKIIQILTNLLNNSLKFTKEGKVECSYTIVDTMIMFTVTDTGIGISEENLSKIFDRFYQVDSAGSRQYGGTGLGLSICKAYVELLGGTINVDSEVGSGTTFIFTIPYVKDKR